MSGFYSTSVGNALLDNVLGAQSYTGPTTMHVAAMTVAPDVNGAGGTEATGGSYGRVAVTNNTTNFPNAASGSKKNASAWNFGTATADWGGIVGLAFYDATTGGNFQGYVALASTVTVLNGNSFSIAVDAVTLTMGGTFVQGGITGIIISVYLANKFLDAIWGRTAYTAPGTVALKLYTAIPTSISGGTETTGTGYSSPSVTNNLTNFPAASSKSKQPVVQFNFGTPTVADWGVLNGAWFLDGSGNILIGAPFSVPVNVIVGVAFSLVANSGTFTVIA